MLLYRYLQLHSCTPSIGAMPALMRTMRKVAIYLYVYLYTLTCSRAVLLSLFGSELLQQQAAVFD